jgi:hypothetical protein
MNTKRRPWLVLIVVLLGVSLGASTKATAAYAVASSPQPSPHPSVGVLFSNGFTFYHFARHHAHVRPAGVEEPPVPADFFDRK